MKKKQRSFPLPGFESSYLEKLAQPKTVIDVGVGYGTYALYEAFPKAKFLLVEPLTEYEPAIEGIKSRYDCEVIYKAVGRTKGVQKICIDKMDLHKSSFADRNPLTATGNPIEKRSIEVTTLDRIFFDNPEMEKPILLKIDTEGDELNVIMGAKSLLKETEIIIAEVSIAKRFDGGYEFEDLIFAMKALGFYLFTFLRVVHVDGELRPRFADVVFKRVE
ncbi:MAG: FkbM family methyltransferase [Pyrinomonadaceae bacterium]|nr:FkbM family methyltransferase [Pyrinomonadaceae bacterium]